MGQRISDHLTAIANVICGVLVADVLVGVVLIGDEPGTASDVAFGVFAACLVLLLVLGAFAAVHRHHDRGHPA